MFVEDTTKNVKKGPAISAFKTKPIMMNPNILTMNRQVKAPITQAAQNKKTPKKVIRNH